MNSLVITPVLVAAGVLAVFVVLFRRARTGPLMPESLFRVSISNTDVVLTDPAGAETRLPWSAITKVCIRTTNEGPLRPDVFWELYDGSAAPRIVAPGGATGEQDLLQAISARLPGASAEAVITAMGSTSNHSFLVWEAHPSPPSPTRPA